MRARASLTQIADKRSFAERANDPKRQTGNPPFIRGEYVSLFLSFSSRRVSLGNAIFSGLRRIERSIAAFVENVLKDSDHRLRVGKSK